MFKKYFDAVDLLADGQEGIFVRLPTHIPALPRNLKGKVMRTDRLARLSTRIIPLLDQADEFHLAAANGNTMAHIKALPIGIRKEHLADRNRFENIARRIEKLAHAYFLAVTQAVYV